MARLRTFIAVGLDRMVREHLVQLQETLTRSAPEVRWVEPENLHLTLLFLGEVNDRDLPAVCRAVAEAASAHAAFTLSLERAGCFGDPRRPRTLWVGIGEGAEEIVALHDGLELPLLELGCYRREARQFTPHITLGRVKSDRPNDLLAAALAKRTDWQGGQQHVGEVLVLSSELLREGPEYTVLSRARLASERKA